MINNLLFVYGTLRRSADTEMAQFLAVHSDFVGPATFQGALYQIGVFPGAISSENPEDKVHGEVFRLNDADKLLPCLDRYEEYGPNFPEPNEYRRQQQKVVLFNGSVVNAWIYLYNRSTAGLKRVESYDFSQK